MFEKDAWEVVDLFGLKSTIVRQEYGFDLGPVLGGGLEVIGLDL